MAAAAAAADDVVEYLHVEANEGGSSGGHVALRLGDDVFHFQYESPGLLVLRRDPASEFRFRYAGLENRTLHALRVDATGAAFSALRERFRERRLVHRMQLDLLAALAQDRELLAALPVAPPLAYPIPGAGYFAPDPTGDPAGSRSAALLRLRERARARDGADFALRRVRALAAEIAALRPDSSGEPAAALAGDGLPRAPRAFSRRFEDLAVAIAALRVLERAPALLPASIRSAGVAELALAPAERALLAAASEALGEQLLRLLRSQRSDFGLPLLVGMARLAALEASLEQDRLVVLDAFPPDAEVLAPARVERSRELLPDLLAQARRQLDSARKHFRSASGFDEAAFSELEEAANRFLELLGAEQGLGMRLHAGPLLPLRPAAIGDLPRPGLSAAELAAARLEAAGRERRFRVALRELRGYGLLDHNCATALFEEIDAALAPLARSGPDSPQDPGARARAASREHLGGHVGAREAFVFVPFASASAVRRSWRIAEEYRIPSWRELQLERMSRAGGGLAARLRESNVLSSRIYRRAEGDSLFLFFADDAALLRPLLGAANLAWSLAGSGAGVLLWPFDAGQTLRSGLRGALFSLPELAFVSLRKGSFDGVPPVFAQLTERRTSPRESARRSPGRRRRRGRAA